MRSFGNGIIDTKRDGVKEPSDISAFSICSSLSFWSPPKAFNSARQSPRGLEDKLILEREAGSERSTALAVILLLDASRVRRRGRGTEARVIVGTNKLPPPKPDCERDPGEENGELKGREVMELCETLRVARTGRENILVGREVRALWDKSRNVSITRSPNESGRDDSLFLWSCEGMDKNGPREMKALDVHR